MKRIDRSAIVEHSAAQIFALVEDIEAYPRFLPWCVAATVDERGPAGTRATLTVGVRGLRQSFTTLNRSRPGEAIDLSLVQGPFRRFAGGWRSCWSRCSIASPTRWSTPSRSGLPESMAVLKVEVVYALPEREESARVAVQSGATVRDVLVKSGLLHLVRGKVGIFGKVVPEDTPVADGDRVEIYRPLAVDPKEARRARAATYTSRSRRAGSARSPSRAPRRR